MKKMFGLLLAGIIMLGCATIPPDTNLHTDEQQPVIVNHDYTLCGSPVKTLYVSGETFDPIGLYIVDKEGLSHSCDEIEVSPIPLTEESANAEISYCGETFSVSVSVVTGEAHAFTSSVSDDENAKAISEFQTKTKSKNLGAYNRYSYPIENKIENPFPSGHVKTISELTQYIDYHAFYGIEVINVYVDFKYSSIDSLLNDLYFRSEFIAGNASMQAYDAGDGLTQIALKYYDENNFLPEQTFVQANFASPMRKTPSESTARIVDGGVTVYSTDQLVYAVAHGYNPDPVPGSPADETLNQAYEILNRYYDVSWSDQEKLFHIALYFLENCVYDSSAEINVPYVPDPEQEPDFLTAQTASFKAEGPILYKQGCCYGFAKAAELLLSLEGFKTTRVVCNIAGCVGRCPYIKEDLDNDIHVIAAHSFLYVRVDEKDCLFDPTFSYSGSVRFGDTSVCRMRIACASMSAAEHRYIYNTLNHDWYALSNEYSPAGLSLTIDSSYNVDSEETLREFLIALKSIAENADGHYNCPVIVDPDVFEMDYINDKVQILFDGIGTNYFCSCEKILISGKIFYVFKITF